MKCSLCKTNPKIYYQRHSGLNFCKECFIKYILKRARKTIGRKNITKNMTITVGLSGGKDSLVMAHVLKELYKPIPNTRIIGVMVDEGIKGYRKEGINHAIEFCEEYGIEYKIATFKETVSHNLDEIIKIAKEKNVNLNPCTFCGVIRRKILNKVSLNENADYLAIGHNLDDIAQAVMMNYIKGDINKLAILGKDAGSSLFVKRIKPLQDIPEQEVLLFADLIGLKYHKEPCPYSSISYRAEVSDIVDNLEKNHPGTSYSIVSGFKKLIKHIPVGKDMSICKYCSEAGSSEICKSCALLEKLGIRI